VSYVNPDNGVFYLAFNLRKEPYSLPEFREAVDMAIDKEFVADSVLKGTVIPAYSTVPNGNVFWWNDGVETPFVGMSREDRVNGAVKLLKDAGWTWSSEPFWDADRDDVTNGEGLRMPNGQLMPETTILGPGPAYDPQRASFNQWISEWMRALGMPVESELTGFNTILDPVFVSADYDMYILGWGLTIYPDYLCDFFYSDQGFLEGGELVGYNTPGLNDAEFDAACDAFLAETDVGRAQEQVYTLQDILADRRPYIPLFYRQSIDLINTRVETPYTETLGGIADASGFQTDSRVLTTTQSR
jgi:ABC-type transport system substrate-binding protein